MKTYLALFSVVFQQHLQYRVAALAGAVTNLAFGFFRLFLLTAFYRAGDAPQPMSLPDLYSYLWLGQVLFSVMPITGVFSADAEEVRTGEVAYRLTRPVSVFSFYFARVMGQKVTALCTRSAIQMAALVVLFPLFGIARYGMQPPELSMLPFLIASLLLAVVLSGAVHTLIYMTGFWTITTRGSATVSYAIISLFSGLLVPLAFFPPVIGRIARMLPFRGMYDTPALIYNGSMSALQAAGAIGHQLLWIGLVLTLGVVLARAGTARLEIAGG